MTLDHLVLATPDLHDTVAIIERLTATAPVSGGSHTGLGTRNYLLGLGDSAYLEIVGPDDEQPEPQGNRPFDVDTLTEARVVTWAWRVDDIATAVHAAREAGYDPGEPLAMSRVTADAGQLNWRLTLDFAGRHSDVVPFLIDWGNTPHPAVNLPHVPLENLELLHPEPDTVGVALRALGVDTPVRPANRYGLRATLSTTRGTVAVWLPCGHRTRRLGTFSGVSR